jgi:hypothetical protein
MEESVQRRLGANQALFREVNEGIERGVWPGDERKPVRFRCECARVGCAESIELGLRDYERVRSHPRHFLVAQKRSEAGVVAEHTDPRR